MAQLFGNNQMNNTFVNNQMNYGGNNNWMCGYSAANNFQNQMIKIIKLISFSKPAMEKDLIYYLIMEEQLKI